MNISNLKVGMQINRYKDLCEILDVKVKNGDYKQLQLLEFESYFKWNQNSGIITEIFDEPKLILDVDFVKLFILEVLIQNKEHGFNLSKNATAKALDIIRNDKNLYIQYKYNYLKPDYILFKSMNDDNIYDPHKGILALIDKAIRQLKNEILIFYNDERTYYFICHCNEKKPSRCNR